MQSLSSRLLTAIKRIIDGHVTNLGDESVIKECQYQRMPIGAFLDWCLIYDKKVYQTF